MTTLPVRLGIPALLAAGLLLLASGCSKGGRFFQTDGPYYTEAYRTVFENWTRDARIHKGLEAELIASTTFKSRGFRLAYADEYAAAYRLTPEEKRDVLEKEQAAAAEHHDFFMACFVPEEKWNDFHRANSMWKLYLIADQDVRVEPIEVTKVAIRDAVTPHFFPYVTPWKSSYIVRFPCYTSSKEPVIAAGTRKIKLVITSVLGSAEMVWDLK